MALTLIFSIVVLVLAAGMVLTPFTTLMNTLALGFSNSVTMSGGGGGGKLHLVLRLRAFVDSLYYVQFKVEGLHFFFPSNLAFKLYVGLNEVITDGDGGVTQRKDDSDWDAVKDGGRCWWLPFYPYIVFEKGLVGVFYIYAEGKRYRIIAFETLEPKCEEVWSDWLTGTGFYKPESTWKWVKAMS